MAYVVTRNEDLQMIDVRYFDRVTVAERAAAMDETLVILRESALRRIAIDFNDARAGSDFFQDTNAFATRVATNALLRECRIAFVGAATNRFNAVLESLSDARGYSFQRFFDRAAAIVWLTR
ncbi:MAG: hypothetical protein ACREPE_05395 [Lysobacter sp.]